MAESAENPFPVVGIGASAGGLSAITHLMAALPPRPGLALVVIQHLDPKHESRLTELLRPHTSMTVVDASHGAILRRMARRENPPTAVKAFEGEAELLAVHQLDLLSQLEAQLRAVHRTMRIIEKLRSDKHRVGRELEHDERVAALSALASELGAIDEELQVQHRSCGDMQELIRGMQTRLSTMRAIATGQGRASSEP
jgi:hypothetical protein